MQKSGDRKLLQVLDLTSLQSSTPKFDPPHHKTAWNKAVKMNVVVRRPVNTIDAIVLHQTATPFGTTPKQIKDAGGDAVRAKHLRALNVAAHMTAFSTGTAVLAHPLDWYVFHANALNARSIGLEIEGKFPFAQQKELLVGNLLAAAKDGFEYLVKKGREVGMPIQYVFAHRQSSPTRDDDPGEEIWRKLVLEFAPTLGIVPQNDYITGGKTIPDQWRGVGRA